MPLIGISGKIGAGKNELARSIVLEGGSHWTEKAFATKLKQICAILTDYEDQYSEAGKNAYISQWGMTNGELQQIIGTDVMRNNFDPDVWINALLGSYDAGKHFWIVTDMRFANELLAIRDRGGFVVRIDGSRTGPRGRDPNHISETALDDWAVWNYRFTNDSDLADLHRHAIHILHEVDGCGML